MSCQLPADCLNEIFEYLEQDKVSLYSCLLVNRLWCEISVRILWRNIWNFTDTFSSQYQLDASLQIISTLVSCLPNGSKDILHKNGIFITTPTWKRSLFNYASFCKVLSIDKIDQIIQQFLEKQQFINSQNLNYNKYLVSQEILRMFMKQIPSLRSLDLGHIKKVNVTFPYLPGAKNCLTDLTELRCSSSIQSEFFYQASQICHNIQSLTIEFEDVSNGLADLISLQNNLKSVTLTLHSYKIEDKHVIVSSLAKFSSTLIKLKITLYNYYIIFTLSFVATFKNLQELVLSYSFMNLSDDLQYVTCPQLKVLKFINAIPKTEVLIKFLEINGKNLKVLFIATCSRANKSLYSAVAKFCPNLQTLRIVFNNNDMDILKLILNSCQYLESVRIYLNEKEILEVIAKHSPKNFHELKLDYVYILSGLLSKNLESFLISWNNRIPQRSLSLIIINRDRRISNLKIIDDANIKLIEKYKKLGIIKKFKIEHYKLEE